MYSVEVSRVIQMKKRIWELKTYDLDLKIYTLNLFGLFNITMSKKVIEDKTNET